VGVLAAAVSLPVASCSAPSTPPQPAPEQVAPLPRELSIDLLQYRSDEVNRVLAVAVGNGGAEEVQVRSLQLRAPGFEVLEPVRFGATIPEGRRFDLRIPFGHVRCEKTAPRGPVTVRLELAGSDLVHEAAPDEGEDLLRRIHAAECLNREVARAVPMSWGTTWQRIGSGEMLAVRGQLRIGPVAPGRSVSVTGLEPTTLFSPGTDRLPVRVGAGDTVTLPVELRPSRCDPHALADSNKGHDIGVRVFISGGGQGKQPQQALVAARPDEAARQILESVWLEACGLA